MTRKWKNGTGPLAGSPAYPFARPSVRPHARSLARLPSNLPVRPPSAARLPARQPARRSLRARYHRLPRLREVHAVMDLGPCRNKARDLYWPYLG